MKSLPSIAVLALACQASHGSEIHVGASQAHATLRSAIASAVDGDTIVAHEGRYLEGNILITKRLRLLGRGAPMLDGGDKHEVLTIRASGSEVTGFTITGAGRSGITDQAGIRVEGAANVTIHDNTISRCHFGIYFSKATHCLARRNKIEGEPSIEQNCGNGVHLWSCNNITVEDNEVTGHRDGIYLEFASQSSILGNTAKRNLRYGLHFMYSHESSYRGNQFLENGAGVAVMYSRKVEMIENRFERNWGGASYGLLLKDMSDGAIARNTFERNSTAVYAQGTSRMKFERNDFLHSGWALRVLSSGEDNVFRENRFIGNSFDVATNGQLTSHEFERNYWDRYEGYDLNRDGTGDVPYHPVSLYSILVERVPPSVLLLRSFMPQVLDRAERAFPSLTPEGVVDRSPALRRPSRETMTQATLSPSNQPYNVMKASGILYVVLLAGGLMFTTNCEKKAGDRPNVSSAGPTLSVAPGPGQSAVSDDVSEKDVVKVAVASPDHTTLVKAVQTADLANALSNAGPFTVFAPTNAAFAKLPPGTVEDLLKPENKAKLQDILQYHVAVGGYKTEMLKDGMSLSMANSGSVKVSVKDGRVILNDSAQIMATVKASNGLVHVVDTVILPPAK